MRDIKRPKLNSRPAHPATVVQAKPGHPAAIARTMRPHAATLTRTRRSIAPSAIAQRMEASADDLPDATSGHHQANSPQAARQQARRTNAAPPPLPPALRSPLENLPDEVLHHIAAYAGAPSDALHLTSATLYNAGSQVRLQLARVQLEAAIVARYGGAEIQLRKRHGETIVTADRIVANVVRLLGSTRNGAFVLSQLIASTSQWHLIKSKGKAGANRDGLLPTLARLVTAKAIADIKGAIGEIQDATFFSERFSTLVAMDQTKEYEDLIHGQYLRDPTTLKSSQQIDLIFRSGELTYYVETKFDVDTAIGAHGPNPQSRKQQKYRASALRGAWKLEPNDPVTIPYPAKHPLERLQVSQQLLGYQAAAQKRSQKRIVRVLSIPNARGWLKLFTKVPSTAGVYIALGWHLRIGTVLLTPEQMQKIQEAIFRQIVGDRTPSWRMRLDNQHQFSKYAADNSGADPAQFIREELGIDL